MALFRLSLRAISRGCGEVVVASSAYITGEELYHEREHWTYDFRWRAHDVVHTELIGAYGWSRAEIWNGAEWAERRWDGVTGREILVALPHELTLGQQIDLAVELGRYLHHRYGVVVDVAVHVPTPYASRDQRNVHAHLLFSAREMSYSGLGERTRVWDSMRTGGPELRKVRRDWADMTNRSLERAGLEVRVDARSYKDQGLDRLPGVHLGRQLWTLEQQGTPTEAGDYNRGVALLNRLRSAVGHKLDWDWEQKARSFGDTDGHRAHAVCRAALFQLRQAEEALKADPLALSAEKRREIHARRQELSALCDLLAPCRDAVVEDRLERRRLQELKRRRERRKTDEGGLGK